MTQAQRPTPISRSTQVRSLVPLAGVAAEIADLSHALTNAVMEEIEMRMSERGRQVSLNDMDSLRQAVFAALARHIIQKVEQRLRDNPRAKSASVKRRYKIEIEWHET